MKARLIDLPARLAAPERLLSSNPFTCLVTAASLSFEG
jgi:hypothetical protein